MSLNTDKAALKQAITSGMGGIVLPSDIVDSIVEIVVGLNWRRQPKSRSRTAAKAAGSGFNKSVVDALAEHIDDRIEKRALAGSKDRGDVSAVRLSPALRSGRVVIECKNERGLHLGTWYGEADVERGNDDAVAGLVAHKRHGKAAGLDQWITCTVRDLVALITGERPE